MSKESEILRAEHLVAEGPSAAAAILQPLLAKLAGSGSDPVSLTLDFGAQFQVGESVLAEAWVDRATRSLIFAHGRITRPSAELVASGSAVFRRIAPTLVRSDPQA